jgi:hypothetical protein
MGNGIEDILDKTGLKSKDINAKNYKKLKFLLSDEDIKVVEKKLGVDKIAEASKKDQKKPKITVELSGGQKQQGRDDKQQNVTKRAKGGIVKRYKGGLMVKPKAAKRGY